MKRKYLLLLVIFCMLISGCSNSNKTKDVKTSGEFNTVALNNNFTVYDNISNYENTDYILEAKISKINENDAIEMVIYKDVESAKKVQEKQVEQFSVRKNTGASIDKDKGSNYYKYVMISNNMYMVSSRIDNTLVFCMTSLNNKDSFSKFIDQLGY